MPDVTGSVFETVEMPDPAHDNFLRFVTRVDGKPVDSQVEQRAFLEDPDKPDVEITERLKSLGVPLIPTMEQPARRFRRLASCSSRRSRMRKSCTLRTSTAAKARNTEPLWTLRSKFWRRQVFPAGRDLRVEQTYTPGLGGQVWFDLGPPGPRRGAGVRIIARLTARTGPSRARSSLSTARPTRPISSSEPSKNICPMSSRPAPIGRGRSEPSVLLSIRGIRPLVSFCGDGVRKIGPTTFEMTAKDYTPKRDIDVLFIKTNSNR